jgi:translocation and assembly module TamA
VTVRVHEQSLQQATVALGWNSLTKARITLEHVDRKIFGRPATLSNKVQWGKDVQAWDATLATHPAESFHSWITGISVSSIQSTSDLVRAGSVRFGRTQNSNALDRTTYLQVERSIQCTPHPKFAGPWNIDPPFEPRYDCVDARALSLNQANVWRNVDSVILPTEGYSLSGQVGVGYAGGPPTAFADPQATYGPYVRLYGRVTRYWPLPDSFHLLGRLELGQIVTKPHVAMPDAEQWRAGGVDSVRGYDWRSLAPHDSRGNIVGGNSLVTASLEIAHPFTESLPSVWWATFVDVGSAATRFSALKWHESKTANTAEIGRGAGVGVRWRSPVGPLKIDLSKGAGIDHLHLDLSIGVVF